MSDEAQWLNDAGVMVGDGVARFRPPGTPTEPSFALLSELADRGPVPAEFRTRPRFAASERGWTARVELEDGTDLYGMGEAAGPLLRNAPGQAKSRIVCWNSDTFEYGDRNESLYQSHPWVLGVRADGSAFGVLADTTWRCAIKWEGGLTFRAKGPGLTVYVIERGSPAQVVEALAALTGRISMPPKWALGYHQSRWSYEPDTRVRELAAEFRRRRMPCDVIWLDIDYMDGFRCFTFDSRKFPDPRRLSDDLHASNFKVVAMIDPGIKVDPGYGVYREGAAGGHFLLDEAGNEYHGRVWPGECAFPDFTRAATRDWWSGLYWGMLEAGFDGFWNDMNEPAVFDNEEKQMPETNAHRADDALGGPGPHARYHNVYGMLMVRATREGVVRERPARRPFVLTRSNFIGGHRYAATWTGDNVSNWDHLAWSIPMALNLGLSGQPFAGPDIGGFSGNATPELFARWMGIGALLPFARGHSIKDSADHEPWSFGGACEDTCRRALERRYRLIPYLYTLFREAFERGVPVVRPLFFADPADPALRAGDDAFLLGDTLLVRACIEPEARVGCKASMPRGIWRRVELAGGARGDMSADPELPKLFVRGGAIIPVGPALQFVDERPLDPLTLIVCPDVDFAARGTLYEDEGEGHAHLEGRFLLTTYAARRGGDELIVEIASREGGLPAADRALEIVVMLDGGVVTAWGRDGEAVRVPLSGR